MITTAHVVHRDPDIALDGEVSRAGSIPIMRGIPNQTLIKITVSSAEVLLRGLGL
jgi:hypothetical protein